MQPQSNNRHIETSRSREKQPAEPVLMDTSEVAAMLSMSTSWVYKEASKLGLKGYKLGRGRNAKVLYGRAEILKWLEQQRVRCTLFKVRILTAAPPCEIAFHRACMAPITCTSSKRRQRGAGSP